MKTRDHTHRAESLQTGQLRVQPEPPEPGDGSITLDVYGRQVLSWERRLTHSAERVWQAITDGREVRRWARASWDFQPHVGGAMTLVLDHDGDAEKPLGDSGVVTVWDPPRVLEFRIDCYRASGPDSGEHYLRWEVEPSADGCVLRFSDVFAPGQPAPPVIASGWQYMLDLLEGDLGKTPGNWDSRHDDMERIAERFARAPRPDDWPD